jgi:hypothetical protein
LGGGLWYLTPLSTIFQVYRGGHKHFDCFTLTVICFNIFYQKQRDLKVARKVEKLHFFSLVAIYNPSPVLKILFTKSLFLLKNIETYNSQGKTIKMFMTATIYLKYC